MREFRVLVLDDDAKVIQRLRDRVSPQHTILGTTWNVLIYGVHIDVVGDVNEMHFSDETLAQLVNSCSHPPHLMLADFGYATPHLREQLRDGLLSPDQFMRSILTMPDLVPEVERYLEANYSPGDPRVVHVHSNLCDNHCKIFLYTYTSLELKEVLPSVAARTKRTQNVFRQSIVVPIDTLEEFYDNGKYADKHDNDFYAYLVAGLLEHLIRQELLTFVLRGETARLKYIRYYRSGAGVLIIVLLGGAIGAVGEWLGARIMALVIVGLWTPAILLLLTAAIVFFILGILVPVFFERFMSNLLRRLRADEGGSDIE